ncbi:MAG: sensor histidine kinase [Methanobrevibacter sp.]
MLYRMKLTLGILLSLFICVAIALSEAIVGVFISMVFKINIALSQENPILFAVCTLTSKFLAFVIILVAKRFKSDIQAKNKITVMVFLLPLASFLIMLLFLRCCYQINDNIFYIITLITSIILSVANVAIFYIIDKQNELIETKEKLLFAEKHINSQVIHYEELYKYQNELRSFRHDIKNILLSLVGLLKDSKTEKAINTIESSLDILDEQNRNIINTGIPVIDAILQSKLASAKGNGVDIKISSKIASEIRIDEIELGIIIGNALDNAVEAIKKDFPSENKEVVFNLVVTYDRISISIVNPVKEDIDTSNLTTSKADKENHGFGIKRIMTLAQKYDGLVSFSCENKAFTSSINLANQSK